MMIKMFRKDVRNRKDIFRNAYEQTMVSFYPCVGLDSNEVNESDKSDALRGAKPVKASIKELSKYVQGGPL